MGSNLNHVVVSGNLTRDVELRSTAGGMSIGGFGLACNDRRKNASGEWEDVPNFLDCVLFGKRAESLQPYLAKGTKVTICGKLRWSQWEKDGAKRSKIEIIVDDIELMSKSEFAGTQPRQSAHDAAKANGYAPDDAYSDEDLPF